MEKDGMGPYEFNERTISVEAAQWLFRMREEPDPKCNEEFVAWLKQSPRHMGEFLFATAALEVARSADPDHGIDADEAPLDKLPNIVSLMPKSESPASARRATNRSSWWARGAMAAVLLLSLSFAAWRMLPGLSSGAGRYATPVGEQRSFKLDDGSVLYLNAQSQAKVAYSKTAREVQLIDGEALFVVARDKRRPFRVRVGAAVVEAVGTQFNIYKRDSRTTVSVIEGRVNVLPDNVALPPIRRAGQQASVVTPLAAGEQAQVSDAGQIAKRAMRDLTRTLAWRQRRLMFEATPLKEVVQEFKHYNRSRIRIEDATIENVQITGTFNADEPQALLQFLRGDSQLVIETNDDEVIIRRPNGM